MNNYYTYIYYDADWVAYYVGKGQCYRKSDRRKRTIPIADNQHTQVLLFNTEWEAYECERELISFWGRKIDGGTLMNVSLGGPGTPGVPNAHNALLASNIAVRTTRVPISLINIETQEVRTFSGVRVACRALGLNSGCLSQVRIGNRQTHKGWRLANDCT